MHLSNSELFKVTKSNFFSLFVALIQGGYSDDVVSKINQTLTVRILVFLAMPIGWLLPLRNSSALFFVFPFFHVGGAERVHADIVACVAERKPWVIFAKKSENKAFRCLFERGARVFNLWPFCKYFYPLSVGITAGFINRHRAPVVFGSNSLFFYLLVPYLGSRVRCVDLMHAFGGGSEDFSLPVAERLHARVAINGKTVDDLKRQYLRHGAPPPLADRVLLIENCVAVPEKYVKKVRRAQLKILYVGRGSEEKRVHLVGRIAARCRQRGLPVEVLLAGDTAHAVDELDRQYCYFLGEIADPAQLNRTYDDADLLLLTSSREGFPMVIMEGMAHGVVPVSTDVGGIPLHVASGGNGWLVPNDIGEELIVDEMCLIIKRMCANRELLSTMSRSAYDYARVHFSGEKICSAYRSLLLDS